MVEKRPYPGDPGPANGVKRPKPAVNIQEKLAEARAKAAAKAAEINAQRAAAAAKSNGASASPSPAPPALSGGSTADKLAAMKARLAHLTAMKGASAAPSSTDTPPVRPSATAHMDVDSRPAHNDSTTTRFATTLGNRRTDSPMPATKLHTPAPKEEEGRANPYFDPKAPPARQRVTRNLLFNRQGKYLEQASKLRRQTKLEEIKALLASRNRKAKLDENSERGFIVEQPPDVEWWDEGILDEKTYDCIDNPSKVKIAGEDSIITAYVQHPVLLKAPQDQLLIPVKPMYLTQKEQAKLRRMRRAEEHKEQQAKIRLGLEPPPPPKVKRGNMMRVMGEQAIADPTAVEMLVEAQIQERQDTHEKANEERQLTKEERRAKLAENQQKDAQKGLHMCVFKVDSLAFGKLRYQVDLNAKQNALTGVTIFNPNMCLIVVEGGFHSIQKYKRLLLHRMKWTENAPPTEAQSEKQAADPQWMKSVDEQGTIKDLSHNKCVLVFEGEVKQRAFRKWGSKVCESDGEAKEVLARSKLDSLWAVAKSTTE